MRSLCDRLVHAGLVCLLVFTPFAFGTVEPWSFALMEWGIVTLVLIHLLGRLWPGAQVRPPQGAPAGGRLRGVLTPVVLFLGFCSLQLVPMPLRWLRVVSPGSARLYESVDFRTWEQIEPRAAHARTGIDDPLVRVTAPERRPISVNPGRTRGRILLLMSLVALFVLVASWADAARALSLLWWVTIVSFLVCAVGLVQLFTWNGKIYWIRNVPVISASAPTAFGPFVNHDHFAGYVEMAIPVAISLAFWLVDRRRRAGWNPGPAAIGEGVGEELREGGGEDRRRLGQGALVFFAVVILVVSLFFSLSRGGILSAGLSGAVLLTLLCLRVASPALRWTGALVLPLVVALLLAWIGAEAVRKQLGTYGNISGEESFQLRAILWKRVVQESPSFAWVGSGLGTFEDSFAAITPAGAERHWDKAHNDYLQLFWETGLLGGLLFLWGVLAFVRWFWWPGLREFHEPTDLMRTGIAVSLLSIAMHSFVDFCLQIGADGFLCALLAGILVALSGATRDRTAPEAARVPRIPAPNTIAGLRGASYITGSERITRA